MSTTSAALGMDYPHYPQHGNQAEGAGFPLARLVGVISLASGALLGAALGPCQGKGTGEHGLFRQLHEVFVAGDLMVADSYYCTYFLLAMMQNRGVDVVFEQHGAWKTGFRRDRPIGTRDHWMTWSKPPRPAWMISEAYEAFADRLPVRSAGEDSGHYTDSPGGFEKRIGEVIY